ncbi:MAG TPA: hypothetical protein VFT75_04805 [Nocardioidaceae bacterium]|jgi:hypothetical protein|nr:hypothetical protein [Nocardioidaceae bacterium]
MHILLWLVPPAAVTVLAMLWATWAGRPRPEAGARTEADHERFAAAITRRHPASGTQRPAPRRDRSTGIAVRPSRARSGSGAQTRRPA